MKRVSRGLVCLLVFSFTLSGITGLAQQRRRQTRANSTAGKSETAQSNLPLKKVILYSNGVAYFERRGEVSGNSNIALQFTPEEIDDVLKSLVILDSNSGHVSSVSFDTAKPLNVALSEFAFNLDGPANEGTGMAKILGSFKGADVEVREGQSTYTGKIVGVEKRDQTVGDHKSEGYWLTIISQNGEARSFQLAQLSSVRLLDPALREEVARYLSLVGTAHRKDNKTLVINANGNGSRELLVSYTVAAPVWKTTYRSVIDDKGHPYLQGWAIVDNVQGEDWQNIDLALVSGMPVSFVQNLKEPLYRSRPVIGVLKNYATNPQLLRSSDGFFTIIEPRTDAVDEVKLSKAASGADSNAEGAKQMKFVYKSFSELYADVLSQSLNQQGSTTASIGELFQYHIDHPVSIMKNQSALIPIVAAQVEGEPVSIFNEEASASNPLSGLRLTNTTGLTLNGGPITIFDGNSYAGEALIDRIKPGETRLISYAVDLGVTVSTKDGTEGKKVTSVKVVNGSVQMTVKNVNTKTYTVSNGSDKTKVLVIEHPRQPEYKLVNTVQPNSVTDDYYRFRVEVQPHATTEFVVKEEQPVSQVLEVSNFTKDKAAIFLQQSYISQELKEKFSQIVDQRAKIDEANRQITAKEQSISTIVSDQTRLRDNMKSLGQSAEERKLLSRYVSKLDETETTLEKLRSEIAVLRESKDKMEIEFNSLVTNLSD